MDPVFDERPYPAGFLRLWLPLARVFVGALFFLLGPLRVTGRYRVPKEGGLLILSNHQADCDPVALQLGCPRPIRFMAKSELFEMKGVRRVLKWWKGFPVKRGEPDRAAIKHAVKMLQAGEVVCVFPEGELSQTGELIPLKPGIALIVRMAGVPVICCGLDGTNRIIPYGSYIPRPAFRTVRMAWGETHTFDKKAETEEIVGWVEGQLRELTGQAD